jgi:hypothetical protein
VCQPAHSAIEETWDELGDSFRRGTQDFLAEGIWPNWQDYARAAIATLGLESSVVPGHEGCWHRRGKAALPIVFRVALLLRTAGEIGPTEMHGGMYTYPGPEEYLGRPAGILPSLKDNGELDGTTPRGLVVRREEEPWIAIRSDGWVLTRHGSVHIREMWQKGVDEVTIAKEIQSLAKWGEADLPAAQKDEVQARST